MDITVMQTEGQAKATAFLDTVLGVEPAPAAQTIGEVAKPAVGTTPPVADTVVTTKPGLADVIRRDREARASATQAQTEAKRYQDELASLKKEHEKLKAAHGVNDPLEFIRTRGLSKEEQAVWGQAFLYDLKPEVAPADFRFKMFEAQQAAKEAKVAQEQERTEAERAQQAQQAQIQGYASELHQHVTTSPAGSHPESEVWFTDEGPDGASAVNHQAYTQSLFATAKNLAERAKTTGQQADLSPANVAKVLEAEVSKRMQRRDAKRAGNAKTETKQTTPVTPVPSGRLAADSTTMSAEGLRSGPPLPPAMTDEERRNRAAAALFGTK